MLRCVLDWYQNTAVIIFACLSSWFVAVLGGGLGWVFIIMATCGTYYRTSIRRVRRNFRDDVRREVAKSRPELEKETLHWMNDFMEKYWPIYAPNLAKGIAASVDAVLGSSTPPFIESLKMGDFTLGTKPPLIKHVQSYRQYDDETIVMDWAFAFTPNDTMDMTANQLQYKINPRVVLEIRIGKAMVNKTMKIIVEDFQFEGTVRLKMKLMQAWPHVERIDMSFMGKPEIDYVCKPLGGDTLGFDINFIPGLESFIKEQIHGTLGPMMYDPNVFPIEVAKLLSGNPVDLAIGVVAVTLHGAQGLKNSDKFSGTPDPYTIISLNNSKELGKTKTVHENANPRWNETFFVIVTNYTDNLTMQVYDYNEVRKDKELGVASFELEKLESEQEHENLQLEILGNGKARGVMQADIRFFPVLKAKKLLDGSDIPPPQSNTGIARITIEQCKDLDPSKSIVGLLNPYAVLLINGKEVYKTKISKRTNNPIFAEPTTSVLITDRKTARVGLVIKDDRDLATDPIVGNFQMKLDDLSKRLDQEQEWFGLHSAKTGRVKLLLDWKPVELRGLSGGSGGYITPIGVMRIHVHGARDLRNFEAIGKSDPYARVLLSGISKGRTVTFKNELNPKWDEVIYIPMHSRNEKLTIEVMDQEKIGKDRSLGLVEIDAEDYIREGKDGLYEVHDVKTPMSESLRLNPKGSGKGTLDYTVSFYPVLNVVDPEEEEEERKAQEEMDSGLSGPSLPSHRKNASLDSNLDVPVANGRTSLGSRKSSDLAGRAGSVRRANSEVEASPDVESEAQVKKPPKIRIEPADLGKYGKSFISIRSGSANVVRIGPHCLQTYSRIFCTL